MIRWGWPVAATLLLGAATGLYLLALWQWSIGWAVFYGVVWLLLWVAWLDMLQERL